MADYIDGFVLPVLRDRLNEYKRLAEAIAEIWKEHGARGDPVILGVIRLASNRSPTFSMPD